MNFRLLGDDMFTWMVWYLPLYSIVFYWFVALIYMVFDLLEYPRFIQKYRIRPDPIDRKKLKHVSEKDEN